MAPLPPSIAEEDAEVDRELGPYRAVSGLAVAGLIMGLFSATALIHPLLWLVACVAIVVNALALRRIAALEPMLIGRKAALVGLASSLIFVISAPVQNLVHRRALRQESMEIAQEWFTDLRENRPEMAHKMSQFPLTAAARLKSPLPDYESGKIPLDPLRKFVRESPVDLLLKLGKRARIRWYAHEDVWADRGLEGVRDIYAVTVGDGPQATSFFIRIGTTRSRDIVTGEWQWQVTKHEFVSATPTGLLGNDG
ncbi:MAG TPA: hypothetical protein VNH11_04185 [Pirellulales bacterium]|nr:hypothetical protein [Pirellulales bacterium]